MKNKWKNSGKKFSAKSANAGRQLKRKKNLQTENEEVTKGQIRNANSRTIFKDPTLSSQFLRSSNN